MKNLNILIKNFMGHKNVQDYTTSWDHLMPVVEKIENTNLDNLKEIQDKMLGKDHYPIFIFLKDRTAIKIAGNWPIAAMFATNRRLSNTYYCIIKFIEWYNQQEKS